MKVQVIDNAIELSLPRSDALLFGISFLLVAILAALAGWRVALAAFGVSLMGAGAVAVAQRSVPRIFGR